MSSSPEFDAEYVEAVFTLIASEPLPDGDVYLYGNLTGYTSLPSSRMDYFADEGYYQVSLLLKQGFYSYMYAFKPSGSNRPDTSVIEGNYYQTENFYEIFLYYKKPGDRYDRLAGYLKLSSAN